MKKVLYFPALIITFVIGVCAFYGGFFLIPVKITEIKNNVPLYEIEKNPQMYSSQKILLRENLIVEKNDGGTFDYYFQGGKRYCHSFTAHNMEYASCLPTALNFSQTVGQKEVRLLEEIAEKNSQKFSFRKVDMYYSAEVEIKGYVRISDGRISIEAASIKQISPIKLVSVEMIK